MGRWEPDAAGRLRQAAIQLFVEQGYDVTTVADIAERAGLTARTFFRYFADKREVLFAGSEELERGMVAAVDDAPGSASPMDAVAAAVEVAGTQLGGHREFSQQRQAIIAAHADLRERELIKFHTLSTTLADRLRARGVDEPDASLAAEAGLVVFRVGFERWLAAPDDRPLVEVMRELLVQFRAIAAAP